MLEGFMEDLLWRFPDESFAKRGHTFTPAVRQFTLPDRGRLDIAFRDASERLWVLEVKAGRLPWGVIDQVHRYAQQLKQAHPKEIVVLAVVSPMITASQAQQLLYWDIESFQIAEIEFLHVAEANGIPIEPAPDIVITQNGGRITGAPVGPRFKGMSKEALLKAREDTPRADLATHKAIRVALRAGGYYLSAHRGEQVPATGTTGTSTVHTAASLRAMGTEELLALRAATPRSELKLHYAIRKALRAGGYYISRNR